MNQKKMVKALRDTAERLRGSELGELGHDACELIRVLARIVEGKPMTRAFGAPGDWGYGAPIGEALSARWEGGGLVTVTRWVHPKCGQALIVEGVPEETKDVALQTFDEGPELLRAEVEEWTPDELARLPEFGG
jgi:hypothetical protein